MFWWGFLIGYLSGGLGVVFLCLLAEAKRQRAQFHGEADEAYSNIFSVDGDNGEGGR